MLFTELQRHELFTHSSWLHLNICLTEVSIVTYLVATKRISALSKTFSKELPNLFSLLQITGIQFVKNCRVLKSWNWNGTSYISIHIEELGSTSWNWRKPYYSHKLAQMWLSLESSIHPGREGWGGRPQVSYRCAHYCRFCKPYMVPAEQAHSRNSKLAYMKQESRFYLLPGLRSVHFACHYPAPIHPAPIKQGVGG